ncbi:MAG: GMC oxidoreductase [Caldilineaceae bacterium]
MARSAVRAIFWGSRPSMFNVGEISPCPGVQSDEEILDWVGHDGETAYHPSCTCKMGVDGMAVVDPATMQVHGVEGLRGRCVGDALYHQRQHLCADNDGRGEGCRPDPGEYAIKAGDGDILSAWIGCN